MTEEAYSEEEAEDIPMEEDFASDMEEEEDNE